MPNVINTKWYPKEEENNDNDVIIQSQCIINLLLDLHSTEVSFIQYMLILTLLLILFLIIFDRKLAKWSLKSLFSLTPPVLSLSTFYFLAWVPLVFCWSAVYCIKSSTVNVNLRNVSAIYVY